MRREDQLYRLKYGYSYPMIISVVMPWRPTPDRISIFNKLVEWYKKELPDLQINTVDAGGDVFNLSASRNKGISQAIAKGADIVIVSDADTFPNKKSLLSACENAYRNKTITLPYKRYHFTRRDKFEENNTFESWYEHTPPVIAPEGGNQTFAPCSGIVVIPKEVYAEIGGFDENYVGWGPEDQDYHRTYLNRYGKLFDYIEGDAYVIDHDRNEFKIEELNKKNHEYFKEKFR